MASELWDSGDAQAWAAARDGYLGLIESLGEKLEALESWYRRLGAALRSRTPAHLTQAELVQLVDWKLTRGKWRPRLLDFAKGADPAAVKDASARGLAALGAGPERPEPPAIKQALAALEELKGVGPATASAVLAAYDPSIPFMSDEAMLAALDSKEYTAAKGLALTLALRAKADALTVKGVAFTAREVEECLFAAAKWAAAAAAPARKGKAGAAAAGKTAPAAKKQKRSATAL